MGFTNLKDEAGGRPSGSPARGAWEKECDVATEFDGDQRGGLVTGVPERSPAFLHYVVARDGERGLEVLHEHLEGNGEVLPVFSAGWAARGYLFAEAPGGGWYVRACTPGELISLLVGPCAGVEWVALDPRPGRHTGEAANLMPWANFVDYLLSLTPPPSHFDGATSRPPKVELHGRRGDQ
jgi:hypothetical protein